MHTKKNYIGSSRKQHKYTNWIYLNFNNINDVAKIHDENYNNLYSLVLSNFKLYLYKFYYDLKFLITGIYRELKRFEILGIFIIIILYLILLFSSYYYINNYVLKD